MRLQAFGASAACWERASSPLGAACFACALSPLGVLVPSAAQAGSSAPTVLPQPVDPAGASAPEAEAVRRFAMDFGLTLAHFQQQAKTEIGGERGQRLVERTELGLVHSTTYQLSPYFQAGVFTQLDFGTSSAGELAGFDENGAATLGAEVGGSHWEWWLGPIVRAQYRFAFFELGWGAVGLRGDRARADIPNESGETQGAFRVAPGVAWLVGLGAQVPLSERFALRLRLQYRVRYYLSRGGRELSDQVALGSQSLSPFIGVSFTL